MCHLRQTRVTPPRKPLLLCFTQPEGSTHQTQTDSLTNPLRLLSLMMSLDREGCGAVSILSCVCAFYILVSSDPFFSLIPVLQLSSLPINRSALCFPLTIPPYIGVLCLQMEGGGSCKRCMCMCASLPHK